MEISAPVHPVALRTRWPVFHSATLRAVSCGWVYLGSFEGGIFPAQTAVVKAAANLSGEFRTHSYRNPASRNHQACSSKLAVRPSTELTLTSST